MAYPVYLTIGNIPKYIHQKPSQLSQVLLAYLSTLKLDHIKNKASHHCCMSNLLHYCIQAIVKPWKSAGHNGIILISGDGTVRRCFPILAAYVGDYPEQVLVSLVKTSNCPVCPALHNSIDDWEINFEPRDTEKIIGALNAVDKGAAESAKACANAGIKPIQCIFWKIFLFLTSTTLSHPISFMNYIKVFSNISLHGFGLCVEMQRSMLGAIVSPLITTSSYLWRVFLICLMLLLQNTVKYQGSFWH